MAGWREFVFTLGSASQDWGGTAGAKIVFPGLFACATFIIVVLAVGTFGLRTKLNWWKRCMHWTCTGLFALRVYILQQMVTEQMQVQFAGRAGVLDYSKMRIVGGMLFQAFVAFLGLFTPASLLVRWTFILCTIAAMSVDVLMTVELDTSLQCIYRSFCRADSVRQTENDIFLFMTCLFLQVLALLISGSIMVLSGFFRDQFPLESNPFRKTLLQHGSI